MLTEWSLNKERGACYDLQMSSVTWLHGTTAIVLCAAAVACYGKAIVDPTDSSGGGGSSASSSSSQGGSSSSSSSSQGGAGADPSCGVPPVPPGPFEFCGGSSASSGTGPNACTTILCDSAGGSWDTTCSGTTCECSYELEVWCTCELSGPEQFCDGITPACCPYPWAD